MNNASLIPTSNPDFFLRKAQPNKKDCDLIVKYLNLLGIHQKTPMTKDPDAIRVLILAEKCEIYFGICRGTEIGVTCISEIISVCSGFTGFYGAFILTPQQSLAAFCSLQQLTLERGTNPAMVHMDNDRANFYHSIGVAIALQ